MSKDELKILLGELLTDYIKFCQENPIELKETGTWRPKHPNIGGFAKWLSAPPLDKEKP